MLEYEELKRQCTKLFKEVEFRASSSPYAAQVVMVRKPDGPIRGCIDNHVIHKRTVKGTFPRLHIDGLIDKLREVTYIALLVLQLAYTQVRKFKDGPTHDSIAPTIFQGFTPSGAPCLLEISLMGFELCNVSPTFTRLMTHVLDPFILLLIIIYLNDICSVVAI